MRSKDSKDNLSSKKSVKKGKVTQGKEKKKVTPGNSEDDMSDSDYDGSVMSDNDSDESKTLDNDYEEVSKTSKVVTRSRRRAFTKHDVKINNNEGTTIYYLIIYLYHSSMYFHSFTNIWLIIILFL